MPDKPKATKRRAAQRTVPVLNSPSEPSGERRVHGTVVSASGSPVVNVKVTAYDQDVSGENTLGSAAPDAQGRYSIRYADSAFRLSKSERRGPDIFVRVYDDQGQLLFQSKTRRNAPQDFTCDVQLPPQRFVVRGTVRDPAGLPLEGATVVAFDRDMRSEERLGQAKADRDGRYVIEYEQDRFCRAEKASADLRVVVLGDRKKEIASSPVRFNAKADETIDLVVEKAGTEAPSEYERLVSLLEPLTQGVPLAQLTDNDIEFLVGDTGEDAQRIGLLRIAAQRAQQTGHPASMLHARAKRSTSKQRANIPTEVFYGWFRQGLPQEPAALWAIDTNELIATLRSGIDSNIVPRIPADVLKELPLTIDTMRVDSALQPAPQGQPASIGDLLATMPRKLPLAKQRVVAAAVRDTTLTDDVLAKRLKDADFTVKEIASVRVTRTLGEVTGRHIGLMRDLQTLRADGGDDSLRFLAPLTPVQWMELTEKHRGEGATAATSPEVYAEQLERAVEDKHPTAVLVARAESGLIEWRDAKFDHAISVLARSPEFELKGGNARRFVDGVEGIEDIEDKDKLVQRLQEIQRAQHFSANWRETAALLNNGFSSTLSVVQFNPAMFREAVATDISPERALTIYAEAQRIHDTVIGLIANTYSVATPWGLFLESENEALEDRLPDAGRYPNLRRLFGNLTTCECDHCQSVLSPAAYLVDLLRFLDPRNGQHSALPAISTLLARRPDIADIELNCANAKTEIPYVDLVNEVFENAIGLPVEIEAPYGFDPQVDLARAPLPNNVTTALRKVLERSAISVGEQLIAQRNLRQFLIGIFVDWTVTDSARRWNLRHYPQALTALMMGFVPKAISVTDYAAARNALDQGQLPDITWLIAPDNSTRAANLPLRNPPTIMQVRAGFEWKATYTRAVRVAFVMASPMSAIVLKTADGQTQLSAQQFPTAMAQRAFAGLRNGQIVEPLRSLLPEGLPYQITSAGAGQWHVSIAYETPINYVAERLQITSLAYQTSDRRDDLLATPENRNPEAYDRLSAAAYPWTLPFNLWLEEVRAFLETRGIARRVLIERCKPFTRLTDQATAREVLGLSLTEWNIAAAISPRPSWEYWGLQQTGNRVVDRNDEQRVATGSWTAVLGFNVSLLMQQAGLSYRELLNVLQTQFVRAEAPVLTPSGDACNPSKMRLQGLRSAHLDRIHRLVRLWRNVGGAMFDLDVAIAATTVNPTVLNEAALLRVANLRRLSELLQRPFPHIATWWGSLATAYRDHTSTSRTEVRSLYEKLFLDPTTVNPPDSDFALNAQRTEIAYANPAAPPLLASKAATICAALGITQSELDALTADLIARQELNAPATLSLTNLQSLLRNVHLATALKLSIADYLRLRSLIGTSVFSTAATAIEFSEQAQRIARSGFTVDALQYLLRYKLSDQPTPLFSVPWASTVLVDIRSTLQALRDDTLSGGDSSSALRKALLSIGWPQALADEATALFAADGRLEVQLSGTANVTIPPALANLVAYRSGEGRLIASPALTANQWNAFRAANAAPAVKATIDALRTKVTEFSAALPAIAHRLQSFELPTFDTSYSPAAVPAIPADLAAFCYFDATAKRIVFVGWMGDEQKSQLAAVTSAATADAIKVKSDQYSEAATLNRFLASADDVRALFSVNETPQTRCDQVLRKLLPYLYRSALGERFAQALELEPPVVNALLTDKLSRTTTLNPLLATEFVDSDARPAVTRSAFPSQFRALCKLHKAGLIARTLKLRAGELRWLPPATATQTAFDALTLDALPSVASDADAALAPLQQLVRLVELRDHSQVGTELLGKLHFFFNVDPATLTAAQANAVAQLAYLAGGLNCTLADVTWAAQSQLNLQWPAEYQDSARIAALIGLLAQRLLAQAFESSADDVTRALTQLAMTWPVDVRNPSKLYDLLQLLATAQRLGAKMAECITLTEDGAATTNTPAKPGKDEAALARRLLRSRYSSQAWAQQLKLIVDPLRHKQRDALVAYLIANPPSNAIGNGVWRSADDLYEHYLIDPQMSACKASSRIVHAISAAQLFVQRCLMSLEPLVSPAEIDAERWKWMKNYRVWEANRKVFLYPENWIEPELRDDKSEIFKELEGQLQQSEFDHERAHELLKGYVKQLEDVANLAIVGMYVEKLGVQGATEARIHVVGRTRNRPSRFFYRRWLVTKRVNRWEPWEQITLEGVKSDHILPFVMRGDVYIAWPEMTQLAAEPGVGGAGAPGAKWRVQMAWIRRTNRGWTDRLLSNDVLEHPWVYGKDENQTFTFRVRGPVSSWTDIDCYGAARDGEITYQENAPSTTDIAPFRSNPSLSRGYPFVKIQVSGRVYASYSNGAVFRPHAGATIRVFIKLNGTQTENDTANKDIKWDEEHGLGLSGAPAYTSTIDVSTTTDANGNFSATLGLAAWLHGSDIFGNHDTGYFRQSVLKTKPTIELLVSLPNKPQQSKSFSYIDATLNEVYQHYTDLRFQQNFIFALSGTAPGGEADRAIRISPIKTFRIYTADDAEFLPLTTALPPLPTGVLTYGSGFKTTQANQSGALTLAGSSGSAVTVWTGVATAYSLLPAAPFEWQGAELAVYRDANNSYFIRRQDPSVDSQAAADRFQIVVNGHSRASDLRLELSRSGLPQLFDLSQQSWQSSLAFDSHTAGTAVDTGRSLTRPAIRFEPDETHSPYASYNTELFFHVPLLIATHLSANQRFADAQQWFHLIFDPTSSDTAPGSKRYWRYLPFRNHSQTKSIDELLTLLGDPNVPATDAEKQRITTQIDTWLKNPFRPHAVARMRPRAYQFAVVFKYLDNLVAWGDSLFRQYTTESINEATQLYILAAKLLGPRPQSIPRSTPRPALTYRQVDDQWDDFSNAWLEVEANLSLQTGGLRLQGVADIAEIYRSNGGVASVSTVGMLYFCVPHNEKLIAFWDKVEERLFNIRHCRNIDGIEQAVPLFQPPIDPALLVRAVAAGLDIGAVLAETNTPLPLYRFNVLLQKANELCNDVKQLGSALLSALEKRDAEQLAQLRSRQEIDLLNAVTEVKQAQIAEANANIDTLRQSEKTAVARFAQYQRVLGKDGAQVPDDFDADIEQTSAITVAKGETSSDVTNLGLTQAELDQIGWSETAMRYGVVAGALSTASGIAHAFPDLNIGSPFFSTKYGGSNLGSIASAVSAFFGILERNATHQSNRSATVAQHQRRQDEWVFQSRMALKEIQQTRRQLIAAEMRADIATKELVNHRKQIKNAEEAERLLREKYTNRELYQWMSQQLSGVYFRAYQLAYDLAKRSEQAFRYELGLTDSNHIQYGYWDSLKKGLLAGERLGYDLKRMDAAYLDQNRREFEIAKQVSLLSLDPMALIALRETGRCEISIPEVLFDLEYPGHYLRRLKSVGITIPCVTGPYASVSCTLTLLKSAVRQSTTVAGQYQIDTAGNADPRFREHFGPIQSIVTSNAQQDSGLFEMNLRDERYLPFEGAGAISTWRLEMPTQFRQFDYDTIADVILHLRYTARDGGTALKQACVSELSDSLNAIRRSSQVTGLIRMFSLKHEFPTQWYRLTRNEASTTARSEEFALAKSRFPMMFAGKDVTLTVSKVDVCLAPISGATGTPRFPKVYLPKQTATSTAVEGQLNSAAPIGDIVVKQLDAAYAGGARVVVAEADSTAGWTLQVERNDLVAFRNGVRDLFLILHYSVA